jgi:hypothetical protein
MLFEAEVRLEGKTVRIGSYGTEKAFDFMLHIALRRAATHARGARVAFAGLHAPPESWSPCTQRSQALIPLITREKYEYSEVKKV